MYLVAVSFVFPNFGLFYLPTPAPPAMFHRWADLGCPAFFPVPVLHPGEWEEAVGSEGDGYIVAASQSPH